MAGPIKRRNFIKATSIFGASMAVGGPASPSAFLPGENDNEIKNLDLLILDDVFGIALPTIATIEKIIRKIKGNWLPFGGSCAFIFRPAPGLRDSQVQSLCRQMCLVELGYLTGIPLTCFLIA